MASVKLSELPTIPEIRDTDSLYITDTDTQSSNKTTVGQLLSHATSESFGDYEENQNWELQAGLATGLLFVKELTIGG